MVATPDTRTSDLRGERPKWVPSRQNRIPDRVGMRFGKLTVLSRAGTTPQRVSTWLCRCDCGTEKVIRWDALRMGQQTCGCSRRNRPGNPVPPRPFLPPGHAARNVTLASYKNGAKNRGIPWLLTTEQFTALTRQNCYYCGRPPEGTCTRARANGAFQYNGLDRVDNARGYTMDNAVSCCKHCNRAKYDKSLEDFVSWVHSVSAHLRAIGLWDIASAGVGT